MHAVYELKDKLCDELEEYGRKDKLDVGSLDVVDKLAHTIKNIERIIENYEGYSSEGDSSYARANASYARGGRGGSRGRRGGRTGANQYGSYESRGSYGSYDAGGYSREGNDMMIEELRDLMNEASDERTKMEFKKFIQKMEQM